MPKMHIRMVTDVSVACRNTECGYLWPETPNVRPWTLHTFQCPRCQSHNVMVLSERTRLVLSE